jgi:hypothetical protein
MIWVTLAAFFSLTPAPVQDSLTRATRTALAAMPPAPRVGMTIAEVERTLGEESNWPWFSPFNDVYFVSYKYYVVDYDFLTDRVIRYEAKRPLPVTPVDP